METIKAFYRPGRLLIVSILNQFIYLIVFLDAQAKYRLKSVSVASLAHLAFEGIHGIISESDTAKRKFF